MPQKWSFFALNLHKKCNSGRYNNNNKIPFQIKFKSQVICCGDGSALPKIEHRLTRRCESEKNTYKDGNKNFSFGE